MQLNENKLANSTEISMLFNIPNNIIRKSATEQDIKNMVQTGIVPLLHNIECSLDRDLLLESEKERMYFSYDTKELTRGDILKRYQAYEIGINKHFLQPDEIRKMEDLPALGFEWITLGLDSVLYNPKTKEIYTPNTNQSTKIKKEGDMGEN